MIVRFLRWALSKFEDKRVEAWPFPTVSEDFDPRPCEIKTKPALKKATTRKTTAKKPAVVAKTVRTKKAK